VSDYFCKIDPSKICQLRIIVRKLEEAGGTQGQVLGRPEEIAEFIENSQTKSRPVPADSSRLANMGTEDTPIKLEELADGPAYLEG
jgi:hypothetical protein